MAKKQSNKPTQTPNEVLTKALKRFNDSWGYAQSSWHKRWERDWKLYNNQRVYYNYQGTADTFVPMAFSTVETKAAALGNSRPRLEFEPTNPLQDADTKVLNALVDEYWDSDRWDVKIFEALRQTLTVGTAPLFMYWDIDRPRLLHFSIKDAIIDPTCSGPEDLYDRGYAGRRYLSSKDDLSSYEVVDTDPKSKTYGELVPRYKNLDKIDAEKNGGDSNTTLMDKASKEMFLGSTIATADKDQIEVIEIWDADRVVSIANRSIVIEDIENPYLTQARMRGDDNPKGIIPFIFIRNYTDVSLFYGKSEIEPIAPSQEMLNDLTNQNIDAVTKQLAPQKRIDPKYIDWIDVIDDKPTTVYPFEPGAIEYLTPPTIPQNAFLERSNIKAEIRETTATDQITKGMSSLRDSTATEINAQLQQAGQRVDIMAHMLEKDGFYYLAKTLFHMIQLYVDTPLLVKVSRSTGTDVAVFDPEQFRGEWEPRVTLEIDAKAKREEQQKSAAMAYQILIQDPTINLEEAKRRLFPKMFDLSAEDINAILTPAPDQPMPGQPQDQTPPSKAPSETINYKDAPEDVKRQIEAQAGLQPSQLPPVEPAPATAAGNAPLPQGPAPMPGGLNG